MQRRTGTVAVVAISMIAACGIDPEREPSRGSGGDPSVGETRQSVISPVGGPCPQFACGANSPVLEVDGFHDFNLLSSAQESPAVTTPNDAGFSIAAVNHRATITSAKGLAYDLRVEDGHIVGRCRTTPCTVLRGAALVGAKIPILREKDRFTIEIATVRQMTYFLGGGTTEAYTLRWTPTDGQTTNLCDNIQVLIDNLAAQPGGSGQDGGKIGKYQQLELMGMTVFETVVFEGDRIDAAKRTMSKDADTDDNWFNIGCAGAALSKVHLTRNSVHSQLPPATPPPAGPRFWEQRQATLKMYSADYCGTGTAFTVAGQALVWKGDQMTDFWAPPLELEARWNEKGAICLAKPRMLHPTSALGASTFPDILNLVPQECSIPACKNTNFVDYDGADRVSANPIMPEL